LAGAHACFGQKIIEGESKGMEVNLSASIVLVRDSGCCQIGLERFHIWDVVKNMILPLKISRSSLH